MKTRIALLALALLGLWPIGTWGLYALTTEAVAAGVSRDVVGVAFIVYMLLFMGIVAGVTFFALYFRNPDTG